MNTGLLLLRVIVGLGFFGHGMQKLTGFAQGPRIKGTISMMKGFGYRPAGIWAGALIFAEVVGGLLLTIGFLIPVSAVLIISDMLHAILKVHLKKGFFSQSGGVELALLYMAGGVTVLLIGPGLYSLDNALSLTYSEPATFVAVVVAGIFLALLPLITKARTGHEIAPGLALVISGKERSKA